MARPLTQMPAAIQALCAAAQRRHLIEPEVAQNLATLALKEQATTPQALFTWLTSLPPPDTLTKQLIALLPPPELKPFGPFHPLAHLADGGMGRVWLCSMDGQGDNLVVVKSSRSLGNPRLLRRLEREARLTNQLVHPHVVRCLASGMQDDNSFWMALEFLPHGDLKDLVDQRGPLPESVALHVGIHITEALAEAHRRRLIHRDIKPANIFIGGGGHCKLADFGIARSVDDAASLLTQPGAVLGSPAFMSPEQVTADSDLDIRTDIYAVGCVIAYALLGRPPFRGKSQEVMHAHMQEPPPDLCRLGVSSPETAAIVHKCMEKERENRYASPLDLRAALLTAVDACSDRGGPEPRMWLDPSLLAASVATSNRTPTDTNLEPPAARGARRHPTDLVDAGIGSEPHTRGSTTTFSPNAPVTAAQPVRTRTPRTASSIITFREPEELAEAANAPAAAPVDTLTVSPDQLLQQQEQLAWCSPWLALVSEPQGSGLSLHLYAGPEVTLGKLARPPVMLTTLLYPLSAMSERCHRISRSHCLLRCTTNGYEIEDLSSANGSKLDEQTLAGGAHVPVPNERRSRLNLAGVLDLDLTPFPGALLISRIGNRAEMHYALVKRSLHIGGPGSEVVLTDAAEPGYDIRQIQGSWMWRPHGAADDAWAPIRGETAFALGQVLLTAVLGNHRLIT